MRALSLFTGYGGIDLALKDYITEVVAYVEIEEYAQKIIGYRMADGNLKPASILADVKNVTGEIGDADIIYGGFPCQDLSNAGLGKGLGGERSGLFFEIVRLTKEIRPSFVFLENVPAIRTRGLFEVVRTFTEIGYDCRWTCITAASLGAPHKRERWFLLAHAPSKGLSSGRQAGINSCEKKTKSRLEYEPERRSFTLADPMRAGSEGQRQKSGGIEKKFENISNFCGWEVEPNVGRVANGTELKPLGTA